MKLSSLKVDSLKFERSDPRERSHLRWVLHEVEEGCSGPEKRSEGFHQWASR